MSIRAVLSIVAVVTLTHGVAACSNGDGDKLKRGTGADDNAADAGVSDPVIAPSGGSVRAPYQIKTTAEIRSALDACFGKGVTTIGASMIQTVDNPAGFLAARQFTEGDDVVAGEAYIIDGDSSVERVGLRNSTISLSILSALQDIGNVVGENCAGQLETNASCNCATREQAHAMLTRCLPSIAPSKYAGLEENFSATCAKDTASAIASLVASTAFGVQ